VTGCVVHAPSDVASHEAPARATQRVLAPEALIEAARDGQMLLLTNGWRRLVTLPAQYATPGAIAAMTAASGHAVQLALPGHRAERLVPNQPSVASIGCRATSDIPRIIAMAIDAARGPEHFVAPGPVCLRATAAGGVHDRLDIAEAAVDLSRLAGLNGSAVISEVDAGEDRVLGSLGRGRIEDILAYRQRHDPIVAPCAELHFTSRWGGDWLVRCFAHRWSGVETLALIKRPADGPIPAAVHFHTMDTLEDMVAATAVLPGPLERMMKQIASQGGGVLLLHDRRDPHALVARQVLDAIRLEDFPLRRRNDEHGQRTGR
jgi:3,4-dihydroxy 2-butanone 4-phosphate synthase/GTP cyclohydrolase II